MKIGHFPERVNENAARIVAAFVVTISIVSIITGSIIPLAILLYGFIARVLYGPKFDPIARIALHWVIPAFKISNKPTSGPPKRFAQFIGVVFASTATAFFFLNMHTAYIATLSILSFFAFLEAALGFCAGCFMFKQLSKWGLVPQEVCERCNNIHSRSKDA